MSKICPVLIVEAATMFLERGGNSPVLLQEVIGEVFENDPPPGVANDVLAVCRQTVRVAKQRARN